MANVETRLISKVVNTGNVKKALRLGVKPDFFHSSNFHVWKSIVAYHSEHGRVPHRKVIARRFPNFVLAKTAVEPYTAIVADLKERERYNCLREAMQEAAKLLPESSDDAYKRLVSGLGRVDEIRAEHESPNSPSIYGRGFGELEPVSMGTLKRPPPYEGILGGRIAKGFPTTLYGDGGQGKSFLALEIAMSAASGRPFLGYPLPKGSVLYLDWELSIEAQMERAFRIAKGMRLQAPPKNLHYMAPRMVLPAMVAKLRQWIQREKYVLVIVDSFGPACGLNPESAQDVMKLFAPLRTLGASILVLDHQSKLQEGQNYSKKSPFGSVYKGNLSRSVLHLEKKFGKPGELKVSLRHIKNTMGSQCDDLGITLTFQPDSIRLEEADINKDPDFAKHSGAKEKIVASLKSDGPGTIEELFKRTGITESTIGNCLRDELEKDGVVIRDGKAGRQVRWTIAANSLIPRLYTKGDLGTSRKTYKLKLKNKSTSSTVKQSEQANS